MLAYHGKCILGQIESSDEVKQIPEVFKFENLGRFSKIKAHQNWSFAVKMLSSRFLSF